MAPICGNVVSKTPTGLRNDLESRGGTVIKFFLHVSREEQKSRFMERLNNPKNTESFQRRIFANASTGTTIARRLNKCSVLPALKNHLDTLFQPKKNGSCAPASRTSLPRELTSLNSNTRRFLRNRERRLKRQSGSCSPKIEHRISWEAGIERASYRGWPA